MLLSRFGIAIRSALMTSILLTCVPIVRAQAPTVITFQSKVLNETRRMFVHLPESYESKPDQRYAVLYALDGNSQSVHTDRTARQMARDGQMPELIIIGVSNVSGGRPRDYTPPFMNQDPEDPNSPMGKGDRFLEFVKTELIPFIDSQYRTTSYRMLAGHSRGGLFTVYTLITEPDLFQAWFAHSSPLWRNDAIMVKKFAEFLTSHPRLDTFFYMSLGSKETDRLAGAYESVRKLLETQASPKLRWQADRTPDADHQNNAQLAAPVGFRALYKDWRAR